MKKKEKLKVHQKRECLKHYLLEPFVKYLCGGHLDGWDIVLYSTL